jgi:predicted glycosyltransferase
LVQNGVVTSTRQRLSSRYLFSSHDGFGLGHVHRNVVIAEALQRVDPEAQITLTTGLDRGLEIVSRPGIELVRMPPLIKCGNGSYSGGTVAFDDAVRERVAIFLEQVEQIRPHVVVVDRHPYGVGGELRPGIERARELGAKVVLGLRDVLDEAHVVRAEIAGAGWASVAELFETVLVYGGERFCDHEAEYGLPVQPEYCGWVVERAHIAPVDPNLLLVTAGGGGDGDATFELGLRVLEDNPRFHGVFMVGPYAEQRWRRIRASRAITSRLSIVADACGCASTFSRAGAVVQMAGYNSTYEALGAGARPILVPRRSPRREQAIRATRLASLGLAHIVDEGADASEVRWLIERGGRLEAGALDVAGIRLDGAAVAAQRLAGLAEGALGEDELLAC